MNSVRTRRGFLKLMSAAAPCVVGAAAIGRDGASAANDRIAMGCIGIGGRGRANLEAFVASSDSQAIAVCDVDAGHRAQARRMVDDYYAAHRGKAEYRGCAEHADFREVIARPDVDALMTAAPDHWHAAMSIMAARAGKDVYCEKPISVCVAEGRAVADEFRRLGRTYQSGTQRRSVGHFRFSCEAVRNGRLGTLKRIIEYLGAGPTCGPEPPQPVPKGFDYDLWLGPAPWAYYTPKRCHGSFRWLLDYSGGKITDQGAHFIDIAQWANDAEAAGPLLYEGTGTFPRDGLWDTPVTYNVVATYANGVKLEIIHPLIDNDWAVRFEGTDGWLLVTRNKLFASRPSLLEPLRASETPLPRSDNHYQNFLDAVRTRRQPIAPPEVAHRSTTVCHLAVLCLRLGRPLRWDSAKEQVIGDADANRLLRRPMREPWTL